MWRKIFFPGQDWTPISQPLLVSRSCRVIHLGCRKEITGLFSRENCCPVWDLTRILQDWSYVRYIAVVFRSSRHRAYVIWCEASRCSRELLCVENVWNCNINPIHFILHLLAFFFAYSENFERIPEQLLVGPLVAHAYPFISCTHNASRRSFISSFSWGKGNFVIGIHKKHKKPRPYTALTTTKVLSLTSFGDVLWKISLVLTKKLMCFRYTNQRHCR